MTRLIIMLMLFYLSVGGVTGCGGQNDSNIVTKTPSVVAYQFTATIDSYDNSIAPFTAVVGDSIYGTFKYDPIAIYLKDTSMVQATIGTTLFNADFNTYNSAVYITNDLIQPLLPGQSTPQKSDLFQWTVHDSKLASQYGLDDFQLVISLHDPTGIVFDNSLVPTELNLSSFSDSSIFLNKQIHNGGGFNFGRAKITSLTRVQ